MTFTRKLMLAATALGLSAAVASAEPALIFDLGGKFDKSFNEGVWNGVWGILRTYGNERNQGDLVELRNNDVGRQGLEIVNSDDFEGICPLVAPLKRFNVTAVRAADVLDATQGLMDTANHRAALDGFGGLDTLRDTVARSYREFRDADAALKDAREEIARAREEEDYIRHAAEELAALGDRRQVAELLLR